MAFHKLSVTSMGRRLYAVRPEGCLGTCGSLPAPWQVVYVTARSPAHARAKARERVFS